MSILDIILLICFIPALIQGLRKGFIAQVVAVISIIAGVWMSFEFATLVSGWLGKYIPGAEQVLKIVAFALILAGVIVGRFLLGKIIEGMFKLVMLDWLNKLLGVIFAMMKTALIVGFLILVFNSINDTFHLVSEKYLSESMLYPPLKGFADSVFPYLRGLFQ